MRTFYRSSFMTLLITLVAWLGCPALVWLLPR